MQDILKESWVYQDIFREGYEKGLKRGLQEAQLQRQRMLLEVFVHKNFPALTDSAKQLGEAIDNPAILHEILLRIIAAQNEAEARDILRD